MAPSAIQSESPYTQGIDKAKVRTLKENTLSSEFNATRHLNFEPPNEYYTLDKLGLSSTGSISPVAITASFPLLSDEGIRKARADLFRTEMLAKHKYVESKDPGVYKLRGYGKDARFVYDMWTSKEMLAACSAAAGCELDVVFDYEIGHINVQLPPGVDEGGEDLERLLPPVDPPRQRAEVSDEEAAKAAEAGIANVTAWHNDSFPWVCVVMLSDPTGMKGGETALRKGDGSILKVRGPSKGYAVMMQGGLINHVALKTLGDGERITMVTSFRPRDPHAVDSSNLGNVKAVSEPGQLFTQWTLYRTAVLEERCRRFAEDLREARLTGDEVEVMVGKWAREQIQYIERTAKELTDEGEKGNYNHKFVRRPGETVGRDL
ncbi:hypothetical protein M409DRAFT_48949 [Zasmidium cellare ATCC 36951]|uniref:Fe2OG dioxygenase domain-containing protein n=1 Tax=Zasmidium cellare ATCC 36951 TaxID=1080233 RepID=A0A6A6D3S1_ZASCE|nr:uncharacterized protein M409DRAFT_48949 [Zasmidium cellare ATCC 36951]KAF2174064.1 hypothetical protein M409DRAFT_48949 [Zasmidium cellare ATCC 36951]